MNQFPVLCILKADIEKLFTPPQAAFKLVFTFNFDDTKTLNPSLTVFKAQNNDIIDLPGTTLSRNSRTYKITGPYHFGNLELTRIKYNTKIKKLPGYDEATRLLFYPYNDAGTQSINYHLVWAVDLCEIEAQAIPLPPTPAPISLADESLNPCPPNQPGQGN